MQLPGVTSCSSFAHEPASSLIVGSPNTLCKTGIRYSLAPMTFR